MEGPLDACERSRDAMTVATGAIGAATLKKNAGGCVISAGGRGMRAYLAIALAAACGAGCVHTIPPPATPEETVPSVETRPLEPGQGRVVVDVTDGPTEVHHFVNTETVVGMDKDVPIVASAVTSELLCVTPCAIAGPIGRYDLAFPIRGGGHFDIAEIDNQAETTVYRRTLGSRRSAGAGQVLGILGTTFGGMSLVCGTVFLPIGLAADEGEGEGFVTAGLVTLIAGAVLTAAGIWGIIADPAIEQPGSAIQFAAPMFDTQVSAEVAAPPAETSVAP
jgi:hypothetical protein